MTQRKGNGLERPAAEGESPVAESLAQSSRILSKAGHVKPCLNLGGPPSKPKHTSVTDSERVPRGKGEKHPVRGVKQT